MRATLVVLTLACMLTSPLRGQRDTVVVHRWVGTHLGRPLHLEFYGDTMLVVNDRHALDFRLTGDSLIATGDTLVLGRYRLSFGRLLLTTPEGVVTMATQNALARPLTGRWTGPLGTDDDAEVEIRLFASGEARWRLRPDGEWTVGEWDRDFRLITFVWEDEEETEWTAQYDPIGNALLFEMTVPESGLTILRRTFR